MQGQHGFSLGHQHATLEEFVNGQPGWALPEHLRFRDGEEEDASGARWDLPDLTRMLEAARNREFRVLVTPDLDRFARSLVKGLVLEEQLKKYGVRIIYQRVPIDDSPEGRLLKHQLFGFAEYEREKFALRSIMGRRQKARAGLVIGTGTPPTGYRFAYQTLDNGRRRVCGLMPDSSKAPLMRDLLRRLIHEPAPDVARDQNERGIASPTGRRWNAQTVLKFAHNPVYDGRWVFGHSGNEPITVAVTPLLDPGEWDRLQAALARRQLICAKRETRESDPYTLRGLLVCGHCHATMQCASNQGKRYYRCGLGHPRLAEKRHWPVCNLPDVPAEPLEAELWQVLKATLGNERVLKEGIAAARLQYDRADALHRDRLAVVDSEIARLRKRLQSLADELIDAGPGAKEAMRQRMKEAEALIARFDGEPSTLAAVRPEGFSPDEADGLRSTAAAIRDELEQDWSATDRRRLFDRLRLHATISVAPADDPNAVRLGRKNRFGIDWQGAIPLLHGDTVQSWAWLA